MTEQDWDDDADVVDAEFNDGNTGLASLTDLGGNGVVDISVPLSTEEARELTDHIKSAADMLYILIARAHAGRAWEALGYGTFADYVRDEFDISRSRAYQLLNQAKVVEVIEAALPDGTDFHLSEAAARDLRSVIGDVVPEIEERTRDLAPNEAGEVVEEILEEHRDKVRDKREQREQDDLEREERAADEAERRGFSDGGGGDYTPPPPPPPPIYDDEDDIDPALIRRNVQAAYDLYSSLSALKSMPDIQAVIDTIPVERRVQINESIAKASAWLLEFQETWFDQPWQEGGSQDMSVEDFGDLGEDDEDDELV